MLHAGHAFSAGRSCFPCSALSPLWHVRRPLRSLRVLRSCPDPTRLLLRSRKIMPNAVSTHRHRRAQHHHKTQHQTALKASLLPLASAASGALLGSITGNAGHGAAIGAGSGLLRDAIIGVGRVQQASQTLQHRYDGAYAQCMVGHGERLPPLDGLWPPPIVACPSPVMIYPAPVYP